MRKLGNAHVLSVVARISAVVENFAYAPMHYARGVGYVSGNIYLFAVYVAVVQNVVFVFVRKVDYKSAALNRAVVLIRANALIVLEMRVTRTVVCGNFYVRNRLFRACGSSNFNGVNACRKSYKVGAGVLPVFADKHTVDCFPIIFAL